MIAEQLSEKIHDLVQHLRETDNAQIGLVDIASVTEVLIDTMEAYFRSINTGVYREFMDISDSIERARQEISQLQPKNLERVHIPRAGQELDAIVQATEAATETIMGAAEEIMAIDGTAPDAEEACMRIFEACSFQDITGQRISKVVATLNHIEERIATFKTVWGVDDGNDDDEAEANLSVGRMDGDVRLEGPALDGEGINQSAVDALLDGDSAPEPEAPPKTEAQPEGETPAADSQPNDKAKAKTKKKAAPKKPAAPKKKKAAAQAKSEKKPEPEKKAKGDQAEKAETPGKAASETTDNAEPAGPATKDASEPASDDDGSGNGGEEATQDDIDALFA